MLKPFSMPASPSPRLTRPLLALLSVGAAYLVTFHWPEHNGLDFDIDTSPRVRAARKRAPYDLSQVRVLKTVIKKVNQEYVEPERIVQKKMLLAGLDSIQRTVAPVLVHYHNGDSELTVQVNNQKKKFRVDDVDSPWTLTWRFQEVFSFLQKNLENEEVKLQDVEYAAVNGMLRTLDPHSVLLTPEEYDEMQLNTQGSFGGLGIVISIRDGQLTIIRPMPDTPASNAGLMAGDRIVKINDESTMNMPLEEAVQRLRGDPGTSVTVWIVREGQRGWAKPRRFDVVRAVIHIESVESQMLSDGVGLIRVKSFQSNTCEDMSKALAELRTKAIRGLVLDLRDNPGGLLQQAVCAADMFLTSGTIVTTSSNDPEKRERKLARRDGTEPAYPMVVLANGGSASASEIVAGALQSHDRALVVGQKTFGKGSVQVLYDDKRDGWALKLTVAQYLTPGDVSIQGVGIVPDIAIDPMTVDRLDMDLEVNKGYLRESDLSAHLTHIRARDTVEPEVVLRYYLPQETRQKLQQAEPEELEENEREDEFLTFFSRDLLARAKRAGRRDMLSDAKPVIEQTRASEMKLAEKDLRRLGVDWSLGPDQGPSEVQVKVSTDRSDNTARAGDPFELKVELKNVGRAPLYQLKAITKSDNRLFNDRELVFGKLDPGQSRKWSATLGLCRTEEDKRSCRLPRSMPDRADGVRIEFDEAYGHAPDAAEMRTTVEALPQPQFAYTLHLADNIRGNGDGQLQRGESATLYLIVKNVGKGKSYETLATLRNLTGRGILLRDGRFQLDGLLPGAERTVAFTFEVLPDSEANEARLEVAITDTELLQRAGEKLSFAIAKAPEKPPRAAPGQVGVRSGAYARERPAANARVVAKVEGGKVKLPSEAKRGGFTRIDLGKGRPGWVANGDLTGESGAFDGIVVDHLDHMPPRLEIDYGDTLVTRKSSIRIRGKASDNSRVHDLYLFVDANKVFYQSNKDAPDSTRAVFDTRVPLHPGINYVTIVARESDDIVSRRVFVVRRDSPDGSLMKTPKIDEGLIFNLEE